jgi:hypothetical protein
VIIFVVAPFDHVILPVLQLPVKLVELPAQMVAGLPEVKAMLGAAGIAFAVTEALADVGLVQPFIVQVTV